MKWYYSIRGDVTRHGAVDDTELAAMVKRGELGPADLIWSESTGGKWVPASAVAGLFPPPAPPMLRLAAQTEQEPEETPGDSRRGLIWAAIALAALALIATLVLILIRKGTAA